MNRLFSSFERVAQNKYDVIIIGSGMYGGYLAYKLAYKSNFTARILLLEKGSHQLYTHHDNMSKYFNAMPELMTLQPFNAMVNGSIPDAVAPDMASFGGKSTVWGRWAPRLSQKALQGWPSHIQERIQGWYDEVERDLFVDDGKSFYNHDVYQSLKSKVDQLNIPTLGECELPPLCIQSKAKFAGHIPAGVYSVVPGILEAKKRYNAVETRGCLDILLNCQVDELFSENAHVLALKVSHAKQTAVLKTNGAQVILAAGALNSTALAATASSNPHIGQHICTHLRSNIVAKGRLDQSLVKHWDFSRNPITSAHLPGQLAGSDFHIQLNIELDDRGHQDGLQFQMTGCHNEFEAQKNYVQQQAIITVKMYVVGQLSAEGHQYDREQRFVNWNLNEADHAMMQHMTQTAYQLLPEIFGDAELSFEHNYRDWTSETPDEFSEFYQPISSSYHESSTLRMGTGIENSVVNEFCRFHDVENLWCVDQAVFPAIGSGNPVPTGKAMVLNVIESMLKKQKLSQLKHAARKVSGIDSEPSAVSSSFKMGSDVELEGAQATAGASITLGDMARSLRKFLARS
jgi:hypothetical protein